VHATVAKGHRLSIMNAVIVGSLITAFFRNGGRGTGPGR
jgi:hypothetical protein